MTNQKSAARATSDYAEEILRQISTQSALLAGFAFAGMSSLSYDVTTSPGLVIAFGICASTSMALELLALVISGLLAFLAKEATDVEQKFELEGIVAWLCYLAGLLAFIAAMDILVWIKIRPAAIPITAISLIVVMVIAWFYIRIMGKS